MELVSGMLLISKDSAFAVLYKHSWNPELVANEAGRLGVPALMTPWKSAHVRFNSPTKVKLLFMRLHTRPNLGKSELVLASLFSFHSCVARRQV